jgi:polysaccharide export outer membrane protein
MRFLGTLSSSRIRIVAVLIGLTAGMLSAQPQPPPPQEPPAGTQTKPSPLAPTSNPEVSAPVDPNGYRIGAEDVIRIMVWREPDLSGVMAVRPDGMITLPLAGDLKASELTPNELTRKVGEAYSKFVNKPEVTVSIQSVGSKKYYLVGAVARPGVVPLVVPTRVLEALNGAGGFKEFANKKKIVILRGDKRIPFNYEEVIKGKKMVQNIFLENGDHIIVRD